MAKDKSRLAEILKQEYKTKGVVGGLASTVQSRIREKTDFRNILFGGSGVGSLIGQKIFGKGYSAVDEKANVTATLKPDITPAIVSQSKTLELVASNSQIFAKNSTVLPMMARDMNLMKLNVFKLVKLQGGVANTNKTDMFWANAKSRENDYEREFKKSNKNSPTKVGDKPKSEDSKSGGIFGFLGSILESVGGKFLPLIATVTAVAASMGLLSKAIKAFYNWFASTSIGKSLGLTPTEDYKMEKNGYSKETNTLVNAGAAIVGGGAVVGAGLAVNKGVKLATQTKGVWGRFLSFVSIKSPTLFGKIGFRLAQAGILVTIPFAGWVMAAVQFGLSLLTAYEVFQLWKEFNKEETDATNTPSKVADSDITVDAAKIENTKIDAEIKRFSSGNDMSLQMNKDYVTKLEQKKTAIAPSTTSPTTVSKTGDGKSNAEAYLGRAMSDSEWDALKRTVYAESSLSEKSYANVMAVILNRARKTSRTINEIITEPYQFQAVTGPSGKGEPNSMWTKGPNKATTELLEKSTSSLSGISTNLDSFTASNPAAYGAVGGQAKFDKKMAEFDAAGAGAPIAGTRFAENLYRPGKPGPGTPALPETGDVLAGLTGGKGGGMESLAGAAMPVASGLITAMTADLSDITRLLSKEMGNITNVTNNNVAANKQAAAPQGPLPSVYDEQFLQLLAKVS